MADMTSRSWTVACAYRAADEFGQPVVWASQTTFPDLRAAEDFAAERRALHGWHPKDATDVTVAILAPDVSVWLELDRGDRERGLAGVRRARAGLAGGAA